MKIEPEITAEQVANELWACLGEIDFRFREGDGVSRAYVNADQVWRWCLAMGWDIPEGCGEARIEQKHREARESVSPQLVGKGKRPWRLVGPKGPLCTLGGRPKNWKTKGAAEEWLENAYGYELIFKEDNL